MCQQRRRHPRRRAQEAAVQRVGIGCLDRFAQFRCVAGQDRPDQRPPSIAQRHLLLVLLRIPGRQPGSSRSGAHMSSRQVIPASIMTPRQASAAVMVATGVVFCHVTICVAGIRVLRGRRVPGHLLLLPARPGSDDRGPQERDSTGGWRSARRCRGCSSPVSSSPPATHPAAGGHGRQSPPRGRAPRRDRPGSSRGHRVLPDQDSAAGQAQTRLPAGPTPGPMPLPFQCVRADRGA